MISWRTRIEAAKQGRVFVRGFTREDQQDAENWGTCAVGEQIHLGRVTTTTLLDPHLVALGVTFYHFVMLSRLFGRFAIRRAEATFEEIENYALKLDLERALRGPAPEPGTVVCLETLP